MKNEKGLIMKKIFVSLVTILFVLSFVFTPLSVNAVSKTGSCETIRTNVIIYENLEKVLKTKGNQDLVDVYVWLKDIEADNIKETVRQELLGNKKLEEATDDEIQQYISLSRHKLSDEYTNQNNKILEQMYDVLGKFDTMFVSRYAPMCILRVTKAQIEEVSNLSDIVIALDYFEDTKIETESNISNHNSGAAYVRDTLGYNGNGIKIGMIEPGNPIAIATYKTLFNLSKIHVLGTYSGNTYEDNLHATRVAAIMVGSGTSYASVYYQGIVPSADLYCTQGSSISQMLTGVETLLNNDVNVINISGGGSAQTNYTLMNLWFDHIAYTEDVHLVKSAGNSYTSNKNITAPGLSYNIVVVGAYTDNNNTFDYTGPSAISDQTLSSSSFSIANYTRYTEGSTNLCKPDLIASGTGISYANIPNTYSGNDISSGTSFAAPQVTAVMAQLMQVNSYLKTKQDQMKAILCASAIYRVDGDSLEQTNSSNRYESCMYEKQGAGILNAYLARYIAASSGHSQSIYMYGNTATTYTYNIYAYSSDIYLRYALPWLKCSTSSTIPSSPSNSASYSDLADYDVSILAPNGLVAFSNCTKGNMELIQLNTSEYGYGTYTITISIKANNNITNFLGMAWY